MVRAKASERNKMIATHFADALTSKDSRDDHHRNKVPVDCKGRFSIYNALVHCLPQIVRDSRKTSTSNRFGISQVELNKTLSAHGYVSFRRRVSSALKINWLCKWKGRSWIDPTNPGDMKHLREKLAFLAQEFSETRSLTVDTVVSYLSSLDTPNRAEHSEFTNVSRNHSNLDSITDSVEDSRPSKASSITQIEIIENEKIGAEQHILDRVEISASESLYSRCASGSQSYNMPPQTCSERSHEQDENALMSIAGRRIRNQADAASDASMADRSADIPRPNLTIPSIGQGLRSGDIRLPSMRLRPEPVYRPAISQVSVLQLAAHTPLDIIDMRRLYTFGYRPDQLWRLLTSLPVRLVSYMTSAANALNHPLGTDAVSLLDVWDEARDVYAAADDSMRQAMEADDEVGYLEICYDPATQCRTHVYLNDRYAALCGTTRPELLARFGAHAVDLPAPAPDFLAALLHGLLGRRETDWMQYVRRECGGRGALVCEESRKRFDWRGRVAKVTTAAREISHAAYDAALAAAPHICPLVCIAGDRRSGAELLAGLETDRRHAERTVGTAEWTERLGRLAESIGPRIVQAAAGGDT